MTDEEFAAWFGEAEPRLRRVLVARFGAENGREAVAEALAWAWENRQRLSDLGNRDGYLYRVAVRKAGRSARHPRYLSDVVIHSDPTVEPRLPWALSQLTNRQRVAVLMVVGYGWTFSEAARALDVSESTLKTHVRRGLHRLRSLLNVEVEANA